MITQAQAERNAKGSRQEDMIRSYYQYQKIEEVGQMTGPDVPYSKWTWSIPYIRVIEVILLFLLLVLSWKCSNRQEEQADNHLWETVKNNSCCFEKCCRPESNANASRSMYGTEGKRTEGP